MNTEIPKQTHSNTVVVASIKDRTLSPTAMAIILYTLSAMQPGYLIALDHLTVQAILGLKRTSFFNSLKILKQLGIFTKCGLNLYKVNVKHIIHRSLKVTG